MCAGNVWFRCNAATAADWARQITFTPTAHILTGPLPDMSNRVVRIFNDHQDYFIRVNFVDEDLMAYRYNRDVSNAQYIFPGVRDVLRGVILAM